MTSPRDPVRAALAECIKAMEGLAVDEHGEPFFHSWPIADALKHAALALQGTAPAEAVPSSAPAERDRTHWDSCWRSHHACAIRKVEDLLASSAPEAARQEPVNSAGLASAASSTGGSEPLGMKRVRELFEAWYSSDGLYPKAIERSGDSYLLASAASAWRAWGACAKAAEVERLLDAQMAALNRRVIALTAAAEKVIQASGFDQALQAVRGLNTVVRNAQ